MLITAGILMLIRNLGHVNLPVVRIMLVCALVWCMIGVARSGMFERGMALGSHMNLDDGEMEYNVLCDSSQLNLSADNANFERMRVRCAAGSATVVLPEGRCVHIEASGAFCVLRAPGGKSLSFGEGTYDSGEGDPLYIEADCTFGQISFVKSDANGGAGR